MSIIRNASKGNFTVIPNHLINDDRLLGSHLALLVYLLSKPPTWDVKISSIAALNRFGGLNKVVGTLRQLRALGYARLQKHADGSTDWEITDECKPNLEKPNLEKPNLEKPNLAFQNVLIKTDLKEKTERAVKTKQPRDFRSASDAQNFDTFWQVYPRKTAKQSAIAAWQKLKPSDELAQEIINHVSIRSRSDEQWTRDNGTAIPYPATFLNGRRWEDSYMLRAPSIRESLRQAASATNTRPFDDDLGLGF